MEYNACCGVLPRFSLSTQVFNLLATGNFENSQLSVSPSADLSRSSCPHLGLCLHPVLGTYIEYKSPSLLASKRSNSQGLSQPQSSLWDGMRPLLQPYQCLPHLIPVTPSNMLPVCIFSPQTLFPRNLAEDPFILQIFY